MPPSPGWFEAWEIHRAGVQALYSSTAIYSVVTKLYLCQCASVTPVPQISVDVPNNACSRSFTETVWTNACTHVQPYERFVIEAQQVSEFHYMIIILRSEQSGVLIVTGTCCYSASASCLVRRNSTSAAQAEAVEGW